MAGSIAKAYVQVIPSAEGIKGKLSGMLGGEAGSAGSSAGALFGSSMIKKVSGILATAGLGKMLTDSLMGGGAMQQSLGGIETLFKDSANTVIKHADQAYRTAGMSANQYMETVTGFSASLLQGLGGDTQKAAQVADMALTDMSDNANKMGTEMEAIKNAYQGFAKQNYTMLDNLKLGYGGTKTEMERLLKDAQALSGVKYDISNLADVYSAIHVIQEEMGITGTTAKEAATTLSGSLASMKAAFSDLLANLALGRDIGPSLAALQETFFTFFTGNLLPMVGNILGTLPQVISGALSIAVQSLNLAATNAESIVKMGVDLVTGIGTAIISAAPNLLGAAVKMMAALGNAIMATNWGEMAKNTINSMRGSLDTAAAEILGTDGEIVEAMLDAVADRLPNVLESGRKMLTTLVDGISTALPGLTDFALRMVTSFVEKVLTGLPQVLNTGKTILLNVVQGISSALPSMLDSAGQAIGTLLKGFVQNLPSIIKAGFDLVVSLITGLGNAAPNLLSGARSLLQNVVSAVKSISWGQVGRDIVSGLINGIGAMGGALWNAARNLARQALNAIKGTLGIKSPSRVMRDEVGKWIPSGVAVGIQANTKPLTDAMHGLSSITAGTMQADLQLEKVPMHMPAYTPKYYGAIGESSDAPIGKIIDLLMDIAEGNSAKMTECNTLIANLLEAVYNLRLSDDLIGQANERYEEKMTIIRGW